MAKAVLSLSLTDGLKNVQGHNSLRGGLLLLCFNRLSVVSLLLHVMIGKTAKQELRACNGKRLHRNRQSIFKSALSLNHAFIGTSLATLRAGNIEEEEAGLEPYLTYLAESAAFCAGDCALRALQGAFAALFDSFCRRFSPSHQHLQRKHAGVHKVDDSSVAGSLAMPPGTGLCSSWTQYRQKFLPSVISKAQKFET